MKTWFITGASRGFGFEIVKAALAAGDQVVATARDPDALSARLADARTAYAVRLDVTDTASVQQAVDQAVEKFGRIDVLVNNAGYGLLGPFETLSPDAIEKQFATNLFGAFAVTRAVLPVMRAQRAGYIISISSIAGIEGIGQASVYCASKFALTGWSEALGQELAAFSIRTTAVHPGRFRTDFLDQSSVVYGDAPITDYHSMGENQTAALNAANHQQAGNPAAFGAAMVELAYSENPPPLFAAGKEAIAVSERKAALLQATTDAWRPLSQALDYVD